MRPTSGIPLDFSSNLFILRRLYIKRSEYAKAQFFAGLARSSRAEDPLAAAAPTRLRDHVCHPGHLRRGAAGRGRFALSGAPRMEEAGWIRAGWVTRTRAACALVWVDGL